MVKVSSLTGEVILNVNKWSAGVKQMQTDAKALEKSLVPIGAVADLVGKSLLAIGAAAAAGLGALAAATKIAADYGDQMRDASIRTGLTTETLSGLKYQAEQTGSSFEDLNSGLKFLGRNFADAAAQGKGKAAEAFNAVGISVKELREANGELEPVLRKVMDQLAAMPSVSDRVAASIALLGKNGPQLIEAFSGGSAAMDEFRKQADLFGLSVGHDATEAADKFNDALNKLKQSALGFSLTIGNKLIPIVTDFIVWTSAAIVTLKDLVKNFDFSKAAVEGFSFSVKSLLLGHIPFGDSVTKMTQGLIDFTSATAKNKKAIDDVTAAEVKRTAALQLARDTLAEKLAREKEHAEAVKKAADALEKLRQEQITQYISLTKMQIDRDQLVADNLKSLNDVTLRSINEYYAEREKAAIDATKAEIETLVNRNRMRATLDQQAADNLKVLNDATLKEINDHFDAQMDGTRKQLDAQEKAAAETRRVWEHAVGNITSDFARGFADVIFEGKKFSDAMKGIAKNMAKGMFEAFTVGLLTPLTSKLAKLGGDLGSILFGGGGGGAAGGGGGITKAFPGLAGAGALGGILGKRGGGAATGGAGMGLGASVLTAGIGSLLPLGISAIGKIGSGRRAADEIVKSQNAFQSAVQGVLSDSSLSAANKSKIVGNLWEGFQANSAAFAAGGGSNAKVANQAFSGLLPWITQAQTNLQKAMGDETSSSGPKTINNFEFNIMIPEGKNARATAQLFKDEVLQIIVDAVKSNTDGVTAAITLGVKNSIAGVVTT